MCQCGLGRVQIHNIQEIPCYFSSLEDDMRLTPPPKCLGVVFFLSILSVLVVLTFLSSWQHVWIVDIFACPAMRSCFLSFQSLLLLWFWRLVVSSDILWISLLAQGRHETGSAMRAFVPWGALRRSWLERAPGAPHPPHGAPHPPVQGLMVPVFMASN